MQGFWFVERWKRVFRHAYMGGIMTQERYGSERSLSTSERSTRNIGLNYVSPSRSGIGAGRSLFTGRSKSATDAPFADSSSVCLLHGDGCTLADCHLRMTPDISTHTVERSSEVDSLPDWKRRSATDKHEEYRHFETFVTTGCAIALVVVAVIGLLISLASRPVKTNTERAAVELSDRR